MHECNKERMDKVAIDYYGKYITYSDLESNIDRCAKALLSSGVKKGDIVSLVLLMTPEVIYLLYAMNRIGIVCNFLAVNSTEEELHKHLTLTESKLVFVQDIVLELIKKAAVDTSVCEIIPISLSESMPLGLRMMFYLKNHFKISLEWKHFLSKSEKFIGEVIYDESDADEVAVLEYTSGTTGESKACMLTNKNINSVCFHDNHVDGLFDLTAGQTILASVPPFLAFGLVTNIVMPLAVGLKLVLCPDPSPKNVASMVVKHKPNNLVTGPTQVDAIIELATKKHVDMSFIKSLCCGGDKLDPTWVKGVNTWLAEYGCKHHLINGYGMTETAATFSWMTDITDYMIPLYLNNVMIRDIDSNVELSFNKEGEIYLSGPSVMKGYYKHPEANDEVFFEENGIQWLRTGDIGYVTNEGGFFISGRIKRIFWGMGSDEIIYRIYPMAIEEVISSCPGVEKVAVVGLRNGNYGYLPIAYIVSETQKDREELKANIMNLCREKLKENSWPSKIIFIDELPITRAGKVDYKELEKIEKQRRV